MKKALLVLVLALSINAWAEMKNFNCKAGGIFDGYSGYQRIVYAKWLDEYPYSMDDINDQLFIQIDIEENSFKIWNMVTDIWTEGELTKVNEYFVYLDFDGSALGYWAWKKGKGVVVSSYGRMPDYGGPYEKEYRKFSMKIHRQPNSQESSTTLQAELNISPRVKSLSMMHDSYWCYFLNEKELQNEQNSYLERIDNWKIYIERAEKNYSKSEKL